MSLVPHDYHYYYSNKYVFNYNNNNYKLFIIIIIIIININIDYNIVTILNYYSNYLIKSVNLETGRRLLLLLECQSSIFILGLCDLFDLVFFCCFF